MNPDTSFLTAEEREVVNLLIQAADLMSEIYKRQATPDYDKLRAEVAAKNDPELLDRFDTFFGPWDSLEEDKPFFGDRPKPAGANFYPADLSKEQFDAYLKAHPDQAEALLKIGESPANETLDKPELAAWTMLSSILLNLDETVTKN
jgi:hypothetical protein